VRQDDGALTDGVRVFAFRGARALRDHIPSCPRRQCTPIRILERLLDALERPGLVVFASWGASPLPGLRGSVNSRNGGFTGLTRAIRWSDAVVTHAGYSSVIATIGGPWSSLLTRHEATCFFESGRSRTRDPSLTIGVFPEETGGSM
jgi:hypothetical protein